MIIRQAVRADGQDSIIFHERLGFKRVGTMEGVGEKFGRRLSVTILTVELTEASKREMHE